MKQNLKLKGRLRNYLYLPLYLTILLVLLNIPIYFFDKRAGGMVTAFLLVYFVCVLMVFLRNKPVLTRDCLLYTSRCV